MSNASVTLRKDEAKSPKPELEGPEATHAREPDESAIEMGSPLKTEREQSCADKAEAAINGKLGSKEENPIVEESKE